MSAPGKKRTSLLAAVRAAPASTPFPSIEELRDMLGIPSGDTSQDADITAMMAATIAIVEAYLGRGIQEFSGTQQFEPVDTRNPKLFLRAFPVQEVRTVTIDGSEVTGWRVFNASGIIEWRDGCGCGWPRSCCDRDPIVVIDYTGGYPDDAWPPDLLDAVLRVFGAKWQATGATGNVMDVTAGGTVRQVAVDGLSVSYESASASASDFDGGPVPPELASVVAILDPYRNRLATGV